MLVIFDLDETLIFTQNDHILVRPYAYTLISKLLKHVDVGIWSAGSEDYVMNVLRSRFEVFIPNFVFIKTRNYCDFYENSLIKPIQKIWNEYPKYNQSNTLIIEDTLSNCIFNRRNAIIVPKFKGNHDTVLNDIKSVIYQFFNQST